MKKTTIISALVTVSINTAADSRLLPGSTSPVGELVFKSQAIDTCAADDLERLDIRSRKPDFSNFQNDPYGLKKIHFNLVIMDVNEDGLITEEEIINYNPRELGFWNKFDTDKDGILTGQDVRLYLETQMVATWRNAFRSLDRNRNGRIEQRDMERAYSAHLDQIDIPRTIEEFDSNGDGQIEIAEYINHSKSKIASTDLRK